MNLKRIGKIIERIVLWQIVFSEWNDNFGIVKSYKWKSLSDKGFSCHIGN